MPPFGGIEGRSEYALWDTLGGGLSRKSSPNPSQSFKSESLA